MFRLEPAPRLTPSASLEAVAFWPVTHLAQLLRTRQVTSRELTEMYLERLKRYNPQLNCVATLTEERAHAPRPRPPTRRSRPASIAASFTAFRTA